MANKADKEKMLEEIEDRVRTIGVLTSGGDAPGMNAAIRAVVRRALAKGLKVRGIRRGYHGLLKEEIIDLTARDVSDIIQRGGTILQTARCQTMRTEEGQQKAAAICKKYGICPRLKLQLWIKKYNNHEELKSSEIGEHTIMTKGRKTAFGGCTEKALKTNKKTDGLLMRLKSSIQSHQIEDNEELEMI